jgi:hypothetical protein
MFYCSASRSPIDDGCCFIWLREKGQRDLVYICV